MNTKNEKQFSNARDKGVHAKSRESAQSKLALLCALLYVQRVTVEKRAMHMATFKVVN
jgi:hypothetical protein